MTDQSVTFKTVWQSLSAINVSKHVEKKGGLSYLSWAWAWGVLMEHFPEAQYEFPAVEHHSDGTVTVHCVVSIGDLSRSMWLPVMDHRNAAIKNPDARKISDAKMRCLVKCLAMFGLGHYIYGGEELPLSEHTDDIKHTRSDPMNRDDLVINDDHRAFAFALRKPGADIAAIVADIKVEGEEFERAVWTLLESHERSAIKKFLDSVKQRAAA